MSCIFRLAVLCACVRACVRVCGCVRACVRACVRKYYRERFLFFVFKSNLSCSSEQISVRRMKRKRDAVQFVTAPHTVPSRHVLADPFWAFPPFISALVPVETEAEVPFAPASTALSNVPSGKITASCVLPTASSPAFPVHLKS